MLSDRREKRIDKMVDEGAELAGGMVEESVADSVTSMFATATSGMALGQASVALGPVGVAAGAAVGIILGKVAKVLFKKAFSKTEKERVVSLFDLSVEKIRMKCESGKEIRDDGFFDEDVDDRSPFEEVLEGVLTVAQREYEERKIPLLANLEANIVFDREVSRPMANQLLRIASDLTYRQILILQLIGLYQTRPELSESGLLRRLDSLDGHVDGIDNVSVATDVYELYRRSLLHSPSVILDVAGIEPAKLILVGCGAKLYELMELGALDYGTREHAEILAFLTGGQVMN